MNDYKSLNNKKYLKRFIFSLACFCTVFVCVFGVFSNFSYNSVQASSSFIKENKYTLGLPSFFTLFKNGTSDTNSDLIATTTSSGLYLSIKNDESFVDSTNDFLLTFNNGNEYINIPLTKNINSQNVSFSHTGSTIYYVRFYDNGFKVLPMSLENVGIYIPRDKASSIPFLFNNSSFTQMQYYTAYSTDGSPLLRLHYAIGAKDFSSSDASNFIMFHIYFTFGTTTLCSALSSPLYRNEVLKIDRSLYISEKIVYKDPTDDLFGTIVNGVSTFLDTEIFPNFTLGSIFALVLGLSFFGFILHIIVK